MLDVTTGTMERAEEVRRDAENGGGSANGIKTSASARNGEERAAARGVNVAGGELGRSSKLPEGLAVEFIDSGEKSWAKYS